MNRAFQQFVWWIGIGGIVVGIIWGGIAFSSGNAWFARDVQIVGGPTPFPGEVSAGTVADIREGEIVIIQTGTAESIRATYPASNAASVVWATNALLWIEKNAVGAVGAQDTSVATYTIMEAGIAGSADTSGEGAQTLYQSSSPISDIAASQTGALLSFVENGQLYVLNRNTRMTRRVSESYESAVWSHTEDALLVANGKEVVYITLDPAGVVQNSIVLQGSGKAQSFAFVRQYAVAASRVAEGVQLELIDLRTSSVVQTVIIPPHSERSAEQSAARRMVEAAQQRVLSGKMSALSVLVSPVAATNMHSVSVFDGGLVAATLQLVAVQNEQGAIDWRLSTETTKELRIDEKPIVWQDSTTLWVLRGSTLSELNIAAGGQKTLSTSMNTPVPFTP